MYISHISIRNFKRFKELELDLLPNLNIIIGDNDSGKSTLLEAIHIALTGRYRGKKLSDSTLPQHLFNRDAEQAFLAAAGKDADVNIPPPEILIRLTITTKQKEKTVTYRIFLDESYRTLFQEVVSDRRCVSLPMEFFTTSWITDEDNRLTVRFSPMRSLLIDDVEADSRSIMDRLLGDSLSADDIIRMSRLNASLRDIMSATDALAELNALVADTDAATPTGSRLSIGTSLNETFRRDYLLDIEADGLPLDLSGSGTRHSAAARLAALVAAQGISASTVLMLEQPERNLSFSSLQRFVAFLENNLRSPQLIITTLSSFVTNKLGLDSVILLSHHSHLSLRDIDPDTAHFFRKIAGYDTLRLILAKRTILVEGDSDELIVQRAYLQRHGHLPAADGIDVMSVKGLSFRRYLHLALPLHLKVTIITDSDGHPDAVEQRFADFTNADGSEIQLFTPHTILSSSDFSGDSLRENFNYNTLEPHLLHSNSLALFNKIFDTSFADDCEMLSFMTRNKSEAALRLFQSTEPLQFPAYIENAIDNLSL